MNPDIIASAIQSARYNEAVVVTTVNNNDDEASSEIVLVACLDQENGGIIWKNATAATGDAADGTSVNTLSTRYRDSTTFTYQTMGTTNA